MRSPPRAKHADLAPLGADALLPRAPEDLAGCSARLRSGARPSRSSPISSAGPTFGGLIDRLERGGHYTCSGAIAGPIVELDLRTFYLNDLTFHGSTVLVPEIFPALVGYIERGEIQPMLAATYPLEAFHAGQQAFIDKRHVGNIAVVP